VKGVNSPVQLIKDAPGFLYKEVWPIFWVPVAAMMIGFVIVVFFTTPVAEWK